MWTAAEDAEILRLWPTYTGAQIAEALGKSRNAVIGRYYRLVERKFPYRAKAAADKHADHLARLAKRRADNEAALALMHRAMKEGASRNQAVKIARKNGATLQAIAGDIGVSRERIRQIVSNAA